MVEKTTHVLLLYDSYTAYAVISFVPDKKWTLQTRENSD